MKLDWNRIIISFIIVVVNFGADQYTKLLAVNHIKNTPRKCWLDDFFCFVYAENDGAFLSLGSDMSPTFRFLILTVLPTVMLLYLLYITFLSSQLTKLQAIAMSFILGGGLSNIYDRINYGKVVDFMNMGIGNLRTGIFNIADVSIMIGIGLFILFNFWKTEEKLKVEN